MDYWSSVFFRHWNRMGCQDRKRSKKGDLSVISIRSGQKNGPATKLVRLEQSDELWQAMWGRKTPYGRTCKTPEEVLDLLERVARAKAKQTFKDPPAAGKKRILKTRPGRNRHHMIPKSRNGSPRHFNLLYMRVPRHSAWHKWAGNATWSEVIAFMEAWVESRRRSRMRKPIAA